ncbi:MAG TPA: undecaprenyl-diphosphate phosphatase [Candidatus Saccharimonadales bacterium]|jgi:undecaprenyl-diphosphatase|nr:undecaprenyl-diphosphate phosphatase [Candidatus Saccharimonadales bacterium]
MTIWEAILLGVVEGVTEFLPISSTGHLTIIEKLLGYSIHHADITAFTAIIQIGAVLATLLYFRREILRIGVAWFRGLHQPDYRKNPDYRFGWAIAVGSLPIGIIGLLFQHHIETTLRSLWVVAIALIVWSGVMWFADKYATQQRPEDVVTWKDTLFIGVVQCLALIPGVSRSGATMSAGLFCGFDRVTVTKLSFFLSIPALLAAGTMQAVNNVDTISNGVGWVPTIVATVVSFGVAYIVVAWLLKFIAKNNYSIFIVYRLALGGVILVLLLTNTISAT